MISTQVVRSFFPIVIDPLLPVVKARQFTEKSKQTASLFAPVLASYVNVGFTEVYWGDYYSVMAFSIEWLFPI